MTSKNLDYCFVRLNICIIVLFVCIHFTWAIQSEETDYDFTKVEHVIKPRQIRIYSKPPGEDYGKQTGRGLHQHLDNALQGGSVGIEFNLKPLRDRWSVFMDKARQFLPLLKRFKKKPIEDTKELPKIPPKDADDAKEERGKDSEVDLKPRLDSEDEYEDEVSMEFEVDPRKKVLDPEDIVLLEREKLVENN